MSCGDNCDLSEYPSSPLSEPYAVQYGDDWVEYTYVCVGIMRFGHIEWRMAVGKHTLIPNIIPVVTKYFL